MSVFFRDRYGCPTLDYRLFGDAGVDTYESFLLRAGGQDFPRSNMRDEMITSLAAAYTDIAVQKYRPVVLYLNGKYWGLHYIREKISEHYVAANYNVPAETVVLAERNGKESDAYIAMVHYAKTHDLAKQEHYNYIASLMDIDEYMDYIIAQICIGNSDNSNVRFFTYEGGKWTWILYDTDLGMYTARYNSVADHLNPVGTAAGDYISTALINALLENDSFKDSFLQRFAWQMNHVWTEENLNAQIDAFIAQIEPDMHKNCERWEEIPYNTWLKYIRYLRNFVSSRRSFLLPYIQDYFDLSQKEMRRYGFYS